MSNWELPTFLPFVRRREPLYDIASPPEHRLDQEEIITGFPGITEPPRDGLHAEDYLRRPARLWTTSQVFNAFGVDMGMETFQDRPMQPSPNAAPPYGGWSVEAPRRVVGRPPSRTSA